MKRADIEAAPTGTEFAFKQTGYAKIFRGTCLGSGLGKGGHTIVMHMRPNGANHFLAARPQQVLMPWPDYEAQQTAKADRDARVQAERKRHRDQVIGQWEDEILPVLKARGAGFKHVSPGLREVTMSWDDLARAMGVGK